MNSHTNSYFGCYADFQTVSKKDAAKLLSADVMIGDVLNIECEIVGEEHRAWLLDHQGACIGFFDPDLSRRLSLEMAKDFKVQAVLALIAFTDNPDDGHYWGEAAITCYDPAYADSFDPFVRAVADRLGQGLRTPVDLGPDAVERVVESNGTWFPEHVLPQPEKVKGTAIIKNRRTLNDKLIVQGRAGNKGCYVASWIFLLAAVALIIFGLKSCFF